MTLTAFINWCRPITERLLANYDGYWNRYRWLIAFACIAAAADGLSTIRFMTADGIEHELHPAIRIAATILGPVAGAMFGKAAQLAAIFLVTLYARIIALYVFVAVTIMYTWAAWYNVWGRDMYVPLIFKWVGLA